MEKLSSTKRAGTPSLQSAECSPNCLRSLNSVQSAGVANQVLRSQSAKNLKQLESESSKLNRLRFKQYIFDMEQKIILKCFYILDILKLVEWWTSEKMSIKQIKHKHPLQWKYEISTEKEKKNNKNKSTVEWLHSSSPFHPYTYNPALYFSMPTSCPSKHNITPVTSCVKDRSGALMSCMMDCQHWLLSSHAA